MFKISSLLHNSQSTVTLSLLWRVARGASPNAYKSCDAIPVWCSVLSSFTNPLRNSTYNLEWLVNVPILHTNYTYDSVFRTGPMSCYDNIEVLGVTVGNVV